MAAGALAASLAVAPALAGKPAGGARGGGGSGGTIELVLLDSSSTGPSFGDQVTFRVSTTATTEPWVNAKCYQNGTNVYSEWRGFFDRYLYGQTFTLGPTGMWTGGAADCTALLVKRTSTGASKTLASTSFHVGA